MNTEQARSSFKVLLQQLEEIATVRDEVKRDAFERRAKMLITQFFTADSEYLNDLKEIEWHGYYDETEVDFLSSWVRGFAKAQNMITTILEQIELTASGNMGTFQDKSILPKSKKVFVVHGHDEAMKQAVARVLEKLDLEPIILHEKPNQGRTIIEKFSDYADVSFAVILLSPDDLAYPKETPRKKAVFRARQNVILELGYFLGKLGRAHVAALHMREDHFELPSDFSGVLFIPFDTSGQWRFDLIRELQACGFDVDANNLTK